MKPTVLITGGSGFLGRRLGKALRDRYKVFLCARNQHQNTLAEKFSGCPSLPVDVARYESIRDAVIETRPDILVHAAATKYVDLGEKYPLECIDVNVLGSQNVAKVAIECKIPVVVGISTDKATPPIRNTYGMTKAVMERLFLGLDGQTSTKFLCTRFGNISVAVGSGVCEAVGISVGGLAVGVNVSVGKGVVVEIGVAVAQADNPAHRMIKIIKERVI